ncbi:hypothetical protein [Kiloniella majae]|uniref:hypothetical protein n=1 Tax=Kiloniella majae TaxID=1938558 RepID=UPI000A278816|nr:hypothetical protein [Kiloniella majae]
MAWCPSGFHKGAGELILGEDADNIFVALYDPTQVCAQSIDLSNEIKFDFTFWTLLLQVSEMAFVLGQ